MAKKNNIVTIDFNVWCTQQQLAELTSTNLSTISMKVKRTLDGTAGKGNSIDYLRIEQLNLTLVKRPD
jgi:hypothetical protein